jgi:Cu/Ag efflux pump CusA
MSMLSYWTIRARLLRVPGVANVAIWGERLQMLQVQVEPDKLKAQNISLNQVMEVTAGAVDAGSAAILARKVHRNWRLH